MSIIDKIFPPVNDFKTFDVIWAFWGFFDFAATPAEIIRAAIFNPGLMKLFHIFAVPLNILNPDPSSWNCLGLKLICFWHLHLGLEHISCSVSVSPLMFWSHQDWLDIGEQ